MKIYDKMGREHKTVPECIAAEKEFDEAQAKEEARKKALSDERKTRAKEVEDALKAVCDAQKAYEEKLDAFLKDYGSFHATIRTGEGNPFNLFEPLFRFPRLF